MIKATKATPPPLLDTAALENNGFLLLNSDVPVTDERTFVVFGVARSGTTMVAGALHHLGIDMGMGSKPNAVFEDVPLATAMEGGDLAAFKALIASRNSAHKVWGWKRPSALSHVERLHKHLRNPEYIVVFRDVFAIANRNRISVRSDVLSNMEQALDQYQRLLGVLRTSKQRMLLISYEKAVLQPKRFTRLLAEYVGVSDRLRIRKASGFVREVPSEYLVASRTWGGIGNLDRVETAAVSGWAKLRDSDTPVEVDVWVDGEHAGRVTADLQRNDLKGKVHPTGHCGFRLLLPARFALQPGSIVRARVAGEARDLDNSPRVFGGAKS